MSKPKIISIGISSALGMSILMALVAVAPLAIMLGTVPLYKESLLERPSLELTKEDLKGSANKVIWISFGICGALLQTLSFIFITKVL